MRDGYKQTNAGLIPNDWSVENLNNILSYDSSNLSLNNLDENKGKYKLYGASGFIKGIDFYQEEEPYFAIVKDGSGYGNLQWCEGKTSILGTLGRLKSKPNASLLFYYYLMHRINFKKYMSGSTIPHLYFKDYGKIIVVKPSFTEQQKIAEILSTVDEAIEKTDAIIEETRQLKKGLMQKLFTEGIGHTKFKETKIGQIPEEWKVMNFEDATNVITDQVANGSFASLRENVKVYNEPNYAVYVRLTDLRKGLEHLKSKYVDKPSYEFLSKSKLYGKEILIANIGANVGEPWLMPDIDNRATLAPNMVLIKTDEAETKFKYLFYYLKSNRGIRELSKAISGSGQPKMNKTDLRKIKVFLPTIKEQTKIAQILSEVDAKIEKEEATKAELKQLKKGLMQVLLTGKVRVKA